MQPPPPTRLPASDVTQEAEALTPPAGDENALWGSRSPDGTYFLYGQSDKGGLVTRTFLDGRTGQECAPPGTYEARLGGADGVETQMVPFTLLLLPAAYGFYGPVAAVSDRSD